MKVKRIRAFLMLTLGAALSGYSLFMINALMASSRAVLMMGSRMRPAGAVPDWAMSALILILILVAGAVLVGIAVKDIIDTYEQ